MGYLLIQLSIDGLLPIAINHYTAYCANATFAKPEIYEPLMERGVKHPRHPSSD